jgi:hypothetical protein
MNRLRSATDRLAHEAVQYFRDALLMDDRMKSDSRVIRRMPPHWMAKPTFESIDWTSFRRERVGTNQESSGLVGRELKKAGKETCRIGF